jgi:hypothetical protein
VKQYSSEYSTAYNAMLNDMVERRLRQSIYAVASFWYTAWVNAGQPDLRHLAHKDLSEEESREFELLDQKWKNEQVKGKACD